MIYQVSTDPGFFGYQETWAMILAARRSVPTEDSIRIIGRFRELAGGRLLDFDKSEPVKHLGICG